MPIIQKENFSITDAVRASFHGEKYRKAIHIHQLAEIVFVIEGEMRVTANGKRTMAKSGDIIIIPPYQPHGFYTNDGQEVKLWMMLFSGNLVSEASFCNNFCSEYESAVFTPSEALSGFVKSRFFDTKEKLVTLDNDGIRKVKATVYPIFDEYISTVPALQEASTHTSGVFASVMNYLSKNFSKNETLSDLALAIGYSESYISHSLKRTLDLSFSELRNTFRIEYAKNLLANGDMSCFCVSIECGFNTQRSFNRVFLEKTGTTPQKYRRQCLSSKR